MRDHWAFAACLAIAYLSSVSNDTGRALPPISPPTLPLLRHLASFGVSRQFGGGQIGNVFGKLVSLSWLEDGLFPDRAAKLPIVDGAEFPTHPLAADSQLSANS